jgi:ubiquitin carboxyl-terminal hydrolase 4/11/15
VCFPLDGIDLGDQCIHPDKASFGSTVYDCYAVSNHFGGLGGGHYTAFARSLENGKWYEFDDSTTRQVSNGVL